MEKFKSIEEQSFEVQKKDHLVNKASLVFVFITFILGGIGASFFNVTNSGLVIISTLFACVIIFISALWYNTKVFEKYQDVIEWRVNIIVLYNVREYFLSLPMEVRKRDKKEWENILRKYYLLAVADNKETLAKEILDKFSLTDEDLKG